MCAGSVPIKCIYLHVFGRISVSSSFLLYNRGGWGRTLFLMQMFITIVERTYQGEGFISRYTYMAAGSINTVWIGNA